MDGLRKTGCILLAAMTALGPALPAAAGGRTETAGELETVRARLTQLMDELDAATTRRSAAQRELRAVEKKEQRARQALLKTRAQVDEARGRQAGLRAQEQAQQEGLSGERDALAQQLRLAYINGPEERLRLVLSQQNVAQLGRQMIYAGYVSRQRSAAIRGIEDQVAQLQSTQRELASEVTALVALEATAVAQLAEITAARDDRAELVANISADVASRDAEIAQLRAQEEELASLLEKLRRTLPARPAESSEPFAGQAAALSWPTDGPLLKRFGDPRADGSLKWSGVLLGAPAGTEVRAVYHGRVVFADWLSGMGLLTILEHDDGYMSLYGHNQDLLKAVGDWVSPGEPIAHVGDSGGQSNAGLYFEIRKDGDPVNPKRWIADP